MNKDKLLPCPVCKSWTRHEQVTNPMPLWVCGRHTDSLR